MTIRLSTFCLLMYVLNKIVLSTTYKYVQLLAVAITLLTPLLFDGTVTGSCNKFESHTAFFEKTAHQDHLSAIFDEIIEENRDDDETPTTKKINVNSTDKHKTTSQVGAALQKNGSRETKNILLTAKISFRNRPLPSLFLLFHALKVSPDAAADCWLFLV